MTDESMLCVDEFDEEEDSVSHKVLGSGLSSI